MLEIDFTKQVVCSWSRGQMMKIVRLAAEVEKKIKGNLEINIISDQTMRKLNRLYRGIDRTTDVLSFAWQEEKLAPGDYLGQICISCRQVERQARELAVAAKEEFIMVLVHGLLHLVGYDHQSKIMAKKMFSQQEKIVQKILAVI